jgi:very-short-patch-repair endonuclease
LAERHGLIKTAANALKAVRLRPSEALDGVPVIIEAADRHRASVGRIARTLERIPVTAGDLDSIDIAALETTRSFAEEIAGGGWPDRLRDAVLGTDCDEHMKSLLRQVDDGRHHLASLRDQGVIVEELAGVEDWTLPTSEPEARAALGTRSLDAEDELIGWSQWLAARVDVEREGLEELIGPFERREAPTADLLACFKFVLFSNLVRTMLSRHPDAALLSGLTQQELRRQFRKADAEAIRLTRLRAAARIAQRPVPHGNQSGPVKSWTQASLLAHEISKQKRHLPIRQLVRRAGHALQALKPCFLMGPLSVAQYLEPGGLEFDLVVMDEASQLKPEDAVGAIARGGQVVVVGDPKQLPPTSFFDRVMREEDGSDEETAVEEGESILDVACSLYQPVRRLRWHYRSRHQSLIAFSNREFYQGNLLVFPSAFEKHPELGVRYLAVRGTYENRRNPAEASALIEAVLEHMHSRPNESLGVVTLNFEQMELIDELLDVRFKDDPEAQAYLESMQENAEPFFVKNLENVQGDERDVVFISCTYGPDGRGNQHQRFGPITGENGHRRLNVLFTRAKRRVHVFSSLDHDRIDERGKAWGVRVLKHYLKYAQTGYLEASETGHHRTPEPSDFERAVGDVLRQAGHDVTTQVGVAGFFIDLGIRNPVKAGAYLLGIECDGATYHSGRSARDRDRLRQEILESHGWQLHRIWSTDWYHSRQREVKRLFDRVEEALEADAAYREWRERKERQESVQGNLVSLREEIVGAFPDVPPDRCLLRDEVLEVLVTKRPVTRDDWFRVIPLSLRERTEAAQVGRYLQRVLDIIREASE